MIKIVKYTPDSATSKVFLEIDGQDYFSEFATLIYFKGIELVARFVSIPFQNTFDVVAPLAEIEYDGETGITPEVLTSLVANNLTTEPTPVDPDVWVRNPQWPAIPSTINFAYIIWAVFDDEPVNGIQLTMNNAVIINWGDGTTSPASSGLTRTKNYDFDTIEAPELTAFDGRNYKPVIIQIDRNGATSINQFAINDGVNLPNNALEIFDRIRNTGGTKNYRLSPIPLLNEGVGISSPTKAIYLESVRLESNLSQSNSGFFGANRVRNFVVPANFFNIFGSAAANYWARGSFCNNILPNIVFNDSSAAFSMFAQTKLKRVGNISGNINTNISSIFQNSTIEEVGTFSFPNQTGSNTSFLFEGTLCLTKVGLINLNAATDLNAMFQSSSVEEVEFVSCAALNVTTNMFTNTGFIKRLIMPGLRVGVSILGNRLQAAALNDFFTSLGTATGTQTINVSRNPGAATCNTSIATAKGFTVITA